MNIDVIALVLAGGRGTRLNVISWKRAKPAVPFGGIYRIIDFTLSNLMYSGVRIVGVMTQYKQTSLMEHLGDGSSWGWNSRGSRLKILHPVADDKVLQWYEGTADAVYRNLNFVEKYMPTYVLVLSGDHIYKMDYRPMIQQHIQTGAGVTVAAMRVPWEETHRFGVMVTDNNKRVIKFVEKSPLKISNLASMGIYVFSTDMLLNKLRELIKQGAKDFGKDVLPALVEERGVYAYEFSGYWRDVGTIPSYYNTSIEVLQSSSGIDLNRWKVRTNMEVKGLYLTPPAYIGPNAKVSRSLISRGAKVYGTVENSIISPGVIIDKNAVVKNSVVMNNTHILPGAVLDTVVVDKDVVISENAHIGRGLIGGENSRYPKHLNKGITVIGKGAFIPPNLTIGSNVIIAPNVDTRSFSGISKVDDGDFIGYDPLT